MARCANRDENLDARLAPQVSLAYGLPVLIIIRFADEGIQKKALGFLIGKFSGHSWATGEMAVPEEALGPMAREGLTFTVEGPATYERISSLRDTVAPAV